MMKGNGRAKTALVAGGAGFLGSHLCDALLAQGFSVVCVDSFLTGSPDNLAHLDGRKDFRLIRHDVCKPLAVPEHLSRVYNLACAASPPRYQADPIHTMMTNVQGTLNLLQLAEAHGARFLQASTSEVYGDPDQHPQGEDYHGNVNCTGPRACYDEGKRAAETLCFDMLRAGRADARVARIFNTYGPRMQPDDGRIVSNLIIQALKGEALTVYGTGQQTRSFCYVSDLIAGMMALMEVGENPGAPVNLGNPGEFTILELAEFVLRETGAASKIAHRPLPADDPQRRRPDISRAKALLGWEPVVPLSEGLPRTIRYFREQMEEGRTSRVTEPLAATA
ncbi:MAG TPA: UDP-glucuronic acid decarboxylase family protein [Mesorhizobium sp.]|jgi:UDP-glucuronate decarboxylase|nr:UDP-glucuronic acid decarboxylase family protein [Mesorhizobium sp.]